MSTDNLISNNRYWLCPLYSFDCDCDNIDVAEGIQIKRIPRKFANFLHEHYPDWSLAEDDDFATVKYMAVLPSVATSDNLLAPIREVSKECDLLFDLVTAFKLCHAGDITPGPLIFAELQNSESYIPKLHGFISHVTHLLNSVSKTNIGFELYLLSKYEFRQSDVPEVNRLMEEIGACRMAGKPSFLPDGKTITLISVLDEALRRFNSAYHGEPQDRLIEQMIAFEFLYIGDNKELGYKLALRTAFLLTRDEDDRRAIFSDMKKAYNLRGKIVHASKQGELPKLDETIAKTEEYLRQSIRRFLLLLSQGIPLQQIQGKLDENILKNGKPLALRE